ncbi:universal stress protein [Puia dinghuensis]|uniref:Universal stress protein n=1 Tax=Puia dinghuensis TaxID=1792502 RepID=A0A8J2UC11_9BACT|nr:universal stress protein [Puia dinghuensis]GGA94570.1 hypothetical protein GCM10011511_17340 [Puia dinghuensis]
MNQVLFVGAGKEFPRGAFTFLRWMQEQEPVQALGLFFCPLDYEAMATASQLPVQAPFDRLVETEKETVQANKAIFARLCEQHYIKYHIHENCEQWDKHILVKESRFADLILLSGELFYSDLRMRQPNFLLQEALQAAECPVLVIPEGYTQCDHLFVAYDGSKESLFAMKQFSYLFPQLSDVPTEIVYVKDEPFTSIPDLDQLRQYCKARFNCISFAKLQFRAAHYFSTWIGEKKHVMLVSGSYGRNAFSYLAKRSFAEQVIHEHKLPVFIAHA